MARCDFTAHGESPEGPDTSTVYTAPSVLCTFKTERPGTIMASSYCNIHGLWESSKALTLALSADKEEIEWTSSLKN